MKTAPPLSSDRRPAALSREEARRIQAQAYEAAFAEWFDALSPLDQLALQRQGISAPIVERSGRRSAAAEFDDPAESNEASAPSDLAEQLEPMAESERAELEANFAQALAWAAQAPDLVQMGRRLSVMLHIYRPALLRGLALEIEAEIRADFEATADEQNAEQIGEFFGCALEWISRGRSFSAWGQRLMAALYVLRPGAIDGQTLQRIGRLSGNKTRQAIDKLVTDFRDTFAGIKSAAMRPDETRLKCQRAQIVRKLTPEAAAAFLSPQ